MRTLQRAKTTQWLAALAAAAMLVTGMPLAASSAPDTTAKAAPAPGGPAPMPHNGYGGPYPGPEGGGFRDHAGPAPHHRGGGFSGPGPGLSTAKQAASMWDDSPVTMEGRLVRNLGGEHYLFQDNSGTITVEIDPECWQGQTITPDDQVLVEGEVDAEWLSVKVDAYAVYKK
jgi:uncharacterized protein (TIGR00156 family)